MLRQQPADGRAGDRMREAVIVTTARTPIGKAYRGTLGEISGPQLAAHALTAALDRADLAGGEIDDVILGCAMQEGTTGYNVARQGRAPRGPACHRAGHDRRPAVRLRA